MSDVMMESSGNVFADLGFLPEDAALMAMRAELIECLRETIAANGWTQIEAAAKLDIGQARVADLVSNQRDKFSLEMLITLSDRQCAHRHRYHHYRSHPITGGRVPA